MNMDFIIITDEERFVFNVSDSAKTNASTRCNLVERIDALLWATGVSDADFRFDVLINFNNSRGEMLYLSIHKDYGNEAFIICEPLTISSTSTIRTLASADKCKKAVLDLFDLCSRQTNVTILK